MHRGTSLPPGIEVLHATAADQPVLANLLELYSHDMSETVEVQLQPDGRFGYPELPLYWSEAGRIPFLVWVDGYLAGFALVSKGSRLTGDPAVWDMTEFFVARRYRKRGIGAAMAHEIWRRLPGEWEVRVREGNRPAPAFWAAAVGAFTGSGDERGMPHERHGKPWRIFSFVSPEAVRVT
jgi:predicted acetyltransferase